MATKNKLSEPVFTRSEVAQILGVTPLTIRNRENAKKYPPPRRDPMNNYRIYSLVEVLDLQLLSFQKVDPRPIMSIMFDKGVRDPKVVSQLMDKALAARKGLSP